MDNPCKHWNGKVIGEFICDNIEIWNESECLEINPKTGVSYLCEMSCVPWTELKQYKGNSEIIYTWHISDLVIYDESKELGEFYFPSERYCEKGLCGGCIHDAVPDVYGEYDYDCEWKRPIMRPPQSWCYAEELEANNETIL